jgi:spermidine/putrescine transport system permease protein
MSAKLKPGQGPLEYARRPWIIVLFALVLVFLYAPIASLIVFSFNLDKSGVWHGFTFMNYVKAWHNEAIFYALSNSLTIAILSTIFSTILGAMTALMLWRFQFPFKNVYEGFMALPIVVPEICMGISLAMFFSYTGMMAAVRDWVWPFNLINIIFAHVAFCFPFVAVVVRARLQGFNRQLEEASKDLGASELQTFMNVLVPFMVPSLVAGGLLAFTLSLDDFVITLFSSGPGSVTFPVKIYGMVKRGVDMQINAASTVLIVITLGATLIAMKLQAPAKSEH